MWQPSTILHCYNAHIADIGPVKFTYEQYELFWINHYPGKEYILRNRGGGNVKCEAVYYPLPYYTDLRASVVIDGYDFRDVPIWYLS